MTLEISSPTTTYMKIRDIEDDIVTLIEDQETKIQYVQKILKNKNINEKTFNEFLPLIKDHPTILQIKKFENINNDSVIITEYMKNGSLSDLIDREYHSNCFSKLTDSVKYLIILGVECAIDHLHLNHLYHGNLKTEKIFLDENYHAKLYFDNFPDQKDHEFLSDEEIENIRSDDIFSFLLIFYEIMTGVKLEIDQNNKNVLPDLSLLKNEWQRSFIRKYWSNKYRRSHDFDEISTEISTEICRNKEEFGFLDMYEYKEFVFKGIKYQCDFVTMLEKETNLEDSKDDIFTYGKALFINYNLESTKQNAAKYFQKSS